MRTSQKKQAVEEGAIDLTPMLDVVFIMLIFFIVTATFIKETGVDVLRPEAVTAETKNAAMLVAISDQNEIWIDKKKIDINMVGLTVERLKADNPEGSLVIQVDQEAKAEMIIDVIDAIKDAGVTDISISTEQ